MVLLDRLTVRGLQESSLHPSTEERRLVGHKDLVAGSPPLHHSQAVCEQQEAADISCCCASPSRCGGLTCSLRDVLGVVGAALSSPQFMCRWCTVGLLLALYWNVSGSLCVSDIGLILPFMHRLVFFAGHEEWI